MRSLSARAAGLVAFTAAVWAGLIPYVGPYFHFTLGPDHAWTWTSGRLYLDILPAVAVGVGGVLLILRGTRAGGRLGALLTVAGGAWLAVGPTVSELWHAGGAQGATHGSRGAQMLEQLTLHTGVGVLLCLVAAATLAAPRAAPAATVIEGALATIPEPESARQPRRRRRLGFHHPVGH
jgi:hypothetical protein